jgi:cysteine-rich repeat protein
MVLVPAVLVGLSGCGPDGPECPGVDLQSDAANCGACGRSCDASQVCQRGQCTTLSETEPNDSIQTADDLPSVESHFRGSIGLGDEDFVRFTLTATSDVRLETFDGSGPPTCVDADTVLELLAADGTALAYDDDSGPGYCSVILPASEAGARRLAPGTYFARVRGAYFAPVPAYTLVLQRESVCGDGAVAGSEQCDDGNTVDGDGCARSCVREPTPEIEPNGVVSQAGAIVLPALVSGSLTPTGDVDYFRFTLTATTNLVVETTDGSGNGTCAGIDTLLELRTESGTLVASDDDSGAGYCASLEPSQDLRMNQLPAGTYVVRVSSYDGEPVAAYRLRVESAPAGTP